MPAAEWGPGVYGAESACEYYYRIPARVVDRVQSAQFAAVLPAPLRRLPKHMCCYTRIILERMLQLGW
jgi:monofunctional glycosyltransferase